MSHPWEKQEGESGKAFAAFCLYRDQPPRSRTIEEAWRRYTGARKEEKGRKSGGFFSRWVKNHAWKERADAYDKHQHDAKMALVGHQRDSALRRYWDGIHLALDRLFDPEEMAQSEYGETIRLLKTLIDGVKSLERGDDDAQGLQDIVVRLRRGNDDEDG